MLTSMGDVMREAYKRGWITTRDGNISVVMRNKLYITPSAVRKYTIQVENITRMPFGDKIAGTGKNPSIEIDMHWRIQKLKQGRAVVHLHPTYTIAAMHAGLSLQDLAAQFVELRRYTKVGYEVPFLPPGSLGLAEQTARNIDGFDIVGQVSHGVTAKAANPWDAFEHIERMEHICQIALASGAGT